MMIDEETWLTDTWFDLNITYFDGLLIPPTEWKNTAIVDSLKGACECLEDGRVAIAFNPMIIAQLDNVVFQRFIADILLHEMMHQWLHQQGYSSYTHTEKEWIAECKRIADMLQIKLDTSHARYFEDFPSLSTHISHYQHGKPRKPGATIFCAIEDYMQFKGASKAVVRNYHKILELRAIQETRKQHPYLKQFNVLICPMSYAS